MKRHIIFSGLLMSLMVLSSCNGNFDDWASPQHNDPEDAITVPGFGAAATNAIDLNNAGDSVSVFTLTGKGALPTGMTLQKARIIITPQASPDEPKDATVATLSTSVGGKIDSTALQNAISTNFGRKPVVRTYSAHVYASAMDAKEQAVLIDAGTITLQATPAAPVLSTKGYYIVGNCQDPVWTATSTTYSYEFNGADPYANPVITFKVPRPSDSSTDLAFKILDLNNVNTWDATTVLGAKTKDNVIANDGSETESLVDKNKGNDIKIKATTDKYYEITVNLLDQTISAKTINDPELYLTGSNYEWGNADKGGKWLSLTPVHKADADVTISTFWKIIYLHANEEIKFAPQAGWGNDFAGTEIDDQANSGAAISSGNLKIANAGWYTLVVNRDTKKVSILKPELYLMGQASNDGWNAGSALNKFTVPDTEDGLFISPTFGASKPIRMYANTGFDWWKSEFVVDATGSIIYRGNGGDPQSITATAGQRVYLNFKTDKGEYK